VLILFYSRKKKSFKKGKRENVNETNLIPKYKQPDPKKAPNTK
jgi:hypothetical protein